MKNWTMTILFIIIAAMLQEITVKDIRHSRDITISDMDIKVSNYEGHTMEFVACKNITVKNCKIMPLGKPKKDSGEEQIQIDIAAPSKRGNYAIGCHIAFLERYRTRLRIAI